MLPRARDELGCVDRLVQEVVDAELQRLVAHLAVVARRDHQERRVGFAGAFAKAPGELDAVDARHHVIDDREIGIVVLRPVECLQRLRERMHLAVR
jgi:hypothetical protein